MRYDIQLIHELCQELNLRSRIEFDSELAIELSNGVVLRFVNAERDEDCLVCFDGTGWHSHDEFIFADGPSRAYVVMDYLDVVAGLKDGVILVCESWKQGKLKDRWLIHKDYNDVHYLIDEGEEIRVHRLPIGQSSE